MANREDSCSRLTNQPEAVAVDTGEVTLRGQLVVPADTRAAVVVVDDGACEPGDAIVRSIASSLTCAGFACLLIDLLTREEAAERCRAAYCRNNVQLLASRVVGATDWLSEAPPTRWLSLGYFGARVGAAAALISAAQRPALVAAVVSSSGRPFLARAALPRVRSPTLLLVPASDVPLAKVNRAALAQLMCEKRLELMPDEGDPELLERLSAQRAVEWFERYLVPSECDVGTLVVA